MQLPTSEVPMLSLKITKLNLGFKSFGAEYGVPGASESCNTNVACTQGNGWGDERNSVSLIVANGDESCTGALIMNTCNTNIPYLLTADHCLDAGNVTNWVFQFQYWSSACTTNTGWNEDIQFNGCTLRANDATSDFALLQLSQTPPSNSDIRYAGWSRVATGITSTTIIHHPAGDLMKISNDNGAPATVNIDNIDCWEVDLDDGATEGGTSGAPYFDQNHRIVAQHYGTGQTNLSICQRTIKYGGRFHLSWTGGGTNSTRLSNWLDPTNTSATTTNTTNISSLIPVNFSHVTLSGDATICGSAKTYSLSGSLYGLSVSWSASNSYITLSGSGSSITATPATGVHGYVTLTATVGAVGCQTNNVKTKLIYVGTPVAGFDIESYPYEEPSCFSEWGIYTFRAVQTSGETATGWEWGYRITGVSGDVISPYDSPYYTFIPEQTGSYEVFVRPKNSCGSGSESIKYITVYASCPGFRYITTFPNPAKDELIVVVSNKPGNIKGKDVKTVQLELIDFANGMVIKKWTLAEGQKQYRLSVSDVKKGKYILRVINESNVKGKLVLIDK